MTNSLLPSSYQTDLMLALENILREFENLPVDIIKDFWNPQKCREDLLPFLAIYLGVIQWDSTWEIQQKRDVCQKSLLINKKKGTLASLKYALKNLNINATVVEWWEKQDKKVMKGTASINLHEKDIIYSEEQYKVIYKLINEVKRLSLLVSIKKTSSVKGTYKVSSASSLLSKVSIGFTAPLHRHLKTEGKSFLAVSLKILHKIKL